MDVVCTSHAMSDFQVMLTRHSQKLHENEDENAHSNYKLSLPNEYHYPRQSRLIYQFNDKKATPSNFKLTHPYKAIRHARTITYTNDVNLKQQLKTLEASRPIDPAPPVLLMSHSTTLKFIAVRRARRLSRPELASTDAPGAPIRWTWRRLDSYAACNRLRRSLLPLGISNAIIEEGTR